MECDCGHPIDEPERTHGVVCPGCGAYLLVPNRKDWEAMRANSVLIKKENN